MKNLKIIHILALCLSLVPIALECSRTSSSSASVVAAVQVQKTGYYKREKGSAGCLYIKEGDTFYKYYLPSTTLGRWKTWSKRNLTLAEDARVEADQRFEFYMDLDELFDGKTYQSSKVCLPYFKLKVSVNGYVIEKVEIVLVEGITITEEDLNDQYKLSNLKMNMLQLCIQYSAFADQLQYNGTVLGRGILPSQVKQTVYDGALSPIIRALNSSGLQPRIAEAMRSVVEPYMTAYADEYNIGNMLNQLVSNYTFGENAKHSTQIPVPAPIPLQDKEEGFISSIDADFIMFDSENNYVSSLYALLRGGQYKLLRTNFNKDMFICESGGLTVASDMQNKRFVLVKDFVPIIKGLSGMILGYVSADMKLDRAGSAKKFTVQEILDQNEPARYTADYQPILFETLIQAMEAGQKEIYLVKNEKSLACIVSNNIRSIPEILFL